eukprot:Opistho-1_new@50990
MGCNQSTSKDVQESRQRAPNAAQRKVQTPGSATASPARTIGGAGAGASGDGVQFGKSYTDQRTGETQDFFKDIIQRTAENFIDVTQQSARLEAVDSAERVKEYADAVNHAGLGKGALALYALPKSSVTPAAVVAVMSAPSAVSKGDIDFLTLAATGLLNAASYMQVKDCGALIATLPDI